MLNSNRQCLEAETGDNLYIYPSQSPRLLLSFPISVLSYLFSVMVSEHARLADDPLWYSLLTVDLIWRVLSRSIFHWFVAWIIPLSLLAVGDSVDSHSVQLSCKFALVVDLVTILFQIDRRIAYGNPNPVNIAEQVVVITGGANGLGLVLAQMFGMKGAAVAVLDVVEPSNPDEVKGVTFFKVDASNAADIAQTEKQISKSLGPATILINNAAVLDAKPIWDMSEADSTRSLAVNTLSSFHTIRTFLPGMLEAKHGSIVTISSILGRLGCANLSGYTASKAALLAMHASLRADLRALAETGTAAARNIKTVLVTTGQLNTSMFEDVVTPSAFLAPLVEPVELAKEIVRMVEEGRSGEVHMPLYSKFIPWLDVIPAGLRSIVIWTSRMDKAMSAAVTKPATRGKEVK